MPYLRHVASEDLLLLFEWANDPAVRRNAFNPKPISYARHCSWFSMKLHDRNAYMYVYMEGTDPVGQIRFDCSDGVLEVDVSIAASQRGRGYGVGIIRDGTLLALNEARASYAVAYVLPSNTASLNAFLAVGYNDTGTVTYMGKRVHKLQYPAGVVNAR